MSNGVAVAHLPFPEPASPTPKESELALGAVADAATAIALAVGAFAQNGGLDPKTKELGATWVARIAASALEYDFGDQDFFSKARAAGKKILCQRLNGGLDLRQRDAGVDFYLDALFEITEKVVRDERAFRAAMAN